MVPGQRLVEAELAETLNVTHASVRAALLHLGGEGLAERIPNRGARVRSGPVRSGPLRSPRRCRLRNAGRPWTGCAPPRRPCMPPRSRSRGWRESGRRCAIVWRPMAVDVTSSAFTRGEEVPSRLLCARRGWVCAGYFCIRECRTSAKHVRPELAAPRERKVSRDRRVARPGECETELPSSRRHKMAEFLSQILSTIW
jgi:hypothetical protein